MYRCSSPPHWKHARTSLLPPGPRICKLEFLRIEFERSARELSGENFAQSVARLCEREFPDETLDSVTSSADLSVVLRQ